MVAGIYKITCIKNGKFYIGSSINVKDRISQHKRDLAQKFHCNPKIQNAYNKYGKNNFVFEVIETFTTKDVELIRQVEQGYLNFMQPFGNKGFNIQRQTQLNYKKSNKPKNYFYLLISPTGQVFHNFKFVNGNKTIDTEKLNIRQLSIVLGLDYHAISKLSRGIHKNYKGWTTSFYSHQIIKNYGKFVGNKGKNNKFFNLKKHGVGIVPVYNVKQFAKENSVESTGIYLLIKGKISHYNGWFNSDKYQSLEDAVKDSLERQLKAHRKEILVQYKDSTTFWARSLKDAKFLVKKSSWFSHVLESSRTKISKSTNFKILNLVEEETGQRL